MWDDLDGRWFDGLAAEIVRGRHITDWRPEVERLAARGQDADALALVEECCAGWCAASGLTGRPLPSWWWSTGAWLARKLRAWSRECALYEAWEAHEPDLERRLMFGDRHGVARARRDGGA